MTPNTIRVPTSGESVDPSVLVSCGAFHLRSSPFDHDGAISMSRTAMSVLSRYSYLPGVSIRVARITKTTLTIAESGDETRCDQLTETEGRTLYGCAYNHNARSYEDGLLSTQHVTFKSSVKLPSVLDAHNLPSHIVATAPKKHPSV